MHYVREFSACAAWCQKFSTGRPSTGTYLLQFSVWLGSYCSSFCLVRLLSPIVRHQCIFPIFIDQTMSEVWSYFTTSWFIVSESNSPGGSVFTPSNPVKWEAIFEIARNLQKRNQHPRSIVINREYIAQTMMAARSYTTISWFRVSGSNSPGGCVFTPSNPVKRRAISEFAWPTIMASASQLNCHK